MVPTDVVQVPAQKGTDTTQPVAGTTVVSDDGAQVRLQVTPAAPKPEEKKGDAAGVKPAGERPAYLPEKFKTPEDLAAAYVELEKKLGQTPEVKKADETKPAPERGTAEVTDVLKAAGLDRAKYDAEFGKDGKLSDASYIELAAKGFTKELVDGWIDGQKARADLQMAAVFGAAGGTSESYGKMTEWAKASLTPEEVNAYNKTIDSGDHTAILAAVKGLHARYNADEGSEPKLLGGGTPGVGPRFNSTQELTAAMRDPRYKSGDKAYHAEVDQKLRNSNIF